MNSSTIAPSAYVALKAAFKGTRNVKVTDWGGTISVVYFETPILLIGQDGTFIDNGGFKTVTTKKHLNTALLAAHVAASVRQTKGVWLVTTGGRETAFFRHFPIAAVRLPIAA